MQRCREMYAGGNRQGKNGIAIKVSLANNAETYCLKTVSPNPASDRNKSIDKLKKEVEILKPLSHKCIPKLIFFDLGANLPFTFVHFILVKHFFNFEKKMDN